ENCKIAIHRNVSIDLEDSNVDNDFNNCREKIHNSRRDESVWHQTGESPLHSWVNLKFVMLVFYVITTVTGLGIYFIYCVAKGSVIITRFDRDELWYKPLLFTILFAIMAFYRFFDNIKMMLNLLRTRAFIYNKRKFIGKLCSCTLLLAVFLFATSYYGCVVYKVIKHKDIQTTTDNFYVKVMYVDGDDIKHEITDNEAKEYQKNGEKDKLRYSIVIDDTDIFVINKKEYEDFKNYKGNVKIRYFDYPYQIINLKKEK
ncbi:MAG: hypothetical protein K6G26_08725, partial [Lachnospiraceae bacterium]|nr:hypothetical protein [Lachnospiraceae bacterium]